MKATEEQTRFPQMLPARAALRRLPFGVADVAVLLGALGFLYLVARVGAGAIVRFNPPAELPSVMLDPRYLPYYAARSTMRMFVALFFSFMFTLGFGEIAAHNRRAERVMIPLLDILQSVPVLGFLSITVTAFIALFRGSLLGLEAASIFAIFTSQAWNMTFSYYQSLTTLPRELDEAARLYRLPSWQRFTRLEVPASMIGLTWNAMMSFGGGWFFVAASEAISVLNKSYTLPGIGSYVTLAVENRNFRALLLALLTMAVVIVLVDQLFWKPLVAWADKFRLEQSAAATAPQSWLLNLFRAARLPRAIGGWLTPVGEAINNFFSSLVPFREPRVANPKRQRWGDFVYNGVLLILIVWLFLYGIRFIHSEVGWGEVGHTAVLGSITFARVIALLILSTLVWTPIGVAIGFNPRLARLLQPLAQLAASFPANFLFPFATIFFIRAGISLNWGGILLMALGAQWYILFNVIAGAMSIPTELREMAANMQLRRWQLWRNLIIPGIFPAWVTGGITAAGGAWNASIVAEIVSWGDRTLMATGLGAFIQKATSVGDWPRIVLGVSMMSLFVVGLNRIFWRRLYRLAETKFRLG
jgi:NitT/TauT family transport system permease protein